MLSRAVVLVQLGRVRMVGCAGLQVLLAMLDLEGQNNIICKVCKIQAEGILPSSRYLCFTQNFDVDVEN